MKDSNNKLKILIFGNENCGLIHNLCKGFVQIGYEDVTTAIAEADPFFPVNRYDVFLQKPVQQKAGVKGKIELLQKRYSWYFAKKEFEKDFFSYDLYIFTWRSYRDDLSDLYELKKRGKKIIFLFIGSDVRWIEAFRQQYPSNAYKGQLSEDWQHKFMLLRTAELNCDAIFSVPDQSGLFIRGYFHMFMPIEIENFKFIDRTNEKPVVIHAPSKRDIKGTSIILSAIDSLKNKGISFEFELLENIPNHKLLQKLSVADILVDQLYLNGPATLSTEAMASGCAVATRFLNEYGMTKDAPITYIDENNITDQLEQLIQDKHYRSANIVRGRDFVAHNNNPAVIAKRVIESLEREKTRDYDYMPSFFREKFKLPPAYSYPQEITVLNQMVTSKYS